MLKRFVQRLNHIKVNQAFKEKRRSFSDVANELPKPVDISHRRYDPHDEVVDTTPILIYHGLFGSKLNWKTLSTVITRRTRRVVYALDARNHGFSAHTESMSYPGMVSDALNFVTNRQITKTSLIGHSLGGRAFMLFSLMFPELVDKLILVDIDLRGHSRGASYLPDAVDAMIEAKELFDSVSSLSEARREVGDRIATVVKDPFVRGFLLTNIIEVEGKIKWQFNLDAFKKSFRDGDIREVKVNGTFDKPTLLIRGEISNYVTETGINELKKHFPQLIVENIPGANHYLHVEKPNEFLEAVVNFLKK